MADSSSSGSSTKRRRVGDVEMKDDDDEDIFDVDNQSEDGGDDDDEAWNGEDDDSAACRAASIRARMLNGTLEVRRESLLPCLTVSQIAAVLRGPFRSPCPTLRTEESNRLLCTKTLGLKLGRKGGGMPTGFDFKRVGLPEIEVEDDSDMGDIEPLVLWEASDGSGAKPIKVDKLLLKFLRPHQREGVQFMFECVSGLRLSEKFDGCCGCILADDMGLGKTLQSIALLWTLLRQGFDGRPMVKKAIVVCPTSLVKNWEKEVVKWLKGRVRVMALSESTKEKVEGGIAAFLSPIQHITYDVLVISYETFRLHCDKFSKPSSCDLLICDEAHRLKNDQTLTNQSLNKLACRRRILLSGTPMQNHLDEFYAMVEFTNPGILGTPSVFRKKFEAPILLGREPDATESEKKKGEEVSQELSALVNTFILRRTNALLSAHLPPKIVQVVCIRLTETQKNLYRHFARLALKRAVSAANGTSSAPPRVLAAITMLKKLCNHPKLVFDAIRPGSSENAEWNDCLDLFPPELASGRGGCRAELSGKFAIVESLLKRLRSQTTDRIVLVSNYTQTLDVFQTLCRQHSWPVLRLDGTTSIKKRQELVDKLNDRTSDSFVFLLSSKAGGCGLNMIGANRLILFDPDWNPATDKQAAARVWRDGQNKQVYIYRFFATGTIEEKIYQRQLSKEGLQSIVVDDKSEINSLSTKDLRDLFNLKEDTLSDTLDTLRKEFVARDKLPQNNNNEASSANNENMNDTSPPPPPPPPPSMNPKAALRNQEQIGFPAEEDLKSWGHHVEAENVPDDMLAKAQKELGHISFVFSCKVPGKAI